MVATEYDEKPDNVKGTLKVFCYTVLANEKGKYIIRLTFLLQVIWFLSIEKKPADSMKLDKNMEQFEAGFNSRKNITYSRFKYFTYRQEIEQSSDDYMTELRKLISDCELKGLRESLLRYILIIGLNDKKLVERI